MTTAGDSSSEDAELKDVDEEIRKLRLARNALFDKAKPINDELEKNRRRERKLVEKQHRLITEQHYREKHQQTVQRVIELESQLKQAQSENVRLKQSLDQSAKQSKSQLRKIAQLRSHNDAQMQPKTASRPQEQLNHTTKLLNETREELNETRQRLSEVQDRLNLSEQVTAATQQRAIQECDNSEQLQLELAPQLQTTSHAAGSDILRELYSELATELDARIVAANMYQRNALTLKELQSIQSQRDRPIEAAETLMNIILDQPDAVYLCFLDVLKHTEQQHIYKRVVEGGYKDFDDRTAHTRIIRLHYVFLLETLDASYSGLLGHLYSQEVVSAVERDDIVAEMTSFRANEKLLSVLSRKSPSQFELFLDALDHCGQQHVGHIIAGRPVERQPACAASKTSQVAAVASQTDHEVNNTYHFSHISLGEMTYHFLLHTIDIKRGGLSDMLAKKGIISPVERQKMKAQTSATDKVTSLLLALRQKTATQFESFLVALSDSGQQAVANAIQHALRVVGQLGQNPLQHIYLGQVAHTLPEGDPVWGVTSLGGEIYLLRRKERDQVEVYDVNNYGLLRCLTVPIAVSNARWFTDMTSCEHFLCVYIGDRYSECVHRLDVRAAVFTQWAVGNRPNGISVKASSSLLVTCPYVRKIKEFSSYGDLLHELTLPDYVTMPWHTMQTYNGEYVLCHGAIVDAVHRVCKISADGRHIVHSHGGQRGSDVGQYNVPIRLAVDNNQFVITVDRDNRRVRLLSPMLGHVRDIVSRDQLTWRPCRQRFDEYSRRLYVAENKWNENEAILGRVVVFSV